MTHETPDPEFYRELKTLQATDQAAIPETIETARAPLAIRAADALAFRAASIAVTMLSSVDPGVRSAFDRNFKKQ